jgi:N utilization substance protein B|tara:strand:- start:5711 stop:6196 length:486 start_codon:yes stop_codon:yes gene_type:complete
VISESPSYSSTTKVNLARSVARLSAVQTLYQIKFSNITAEESILHFSSIAPNEKSEDISEKLHEADEGFYIELVKGTQGLVSKINEILKNSLDDSWPIDRMEILLLTILRCGIYEIISHRDIPPAVLISEYISITDSFFSGNESALVNAILDKLSKELRKE